MRKHRRLILLTSALAAAVVLAVFVRSQYVLPVLMYHSVKSSVPEGNRLIVSEATFERQMRFLRERGYTVLSLADIGDYIERQKKLPPRAVVITFDDGYRDNYTYAFPVLKKYNIPATIFLIVDSVGEPDKLTWDQIREMRDSGLISFGSHTRSHPFLTSLGSPDDLRREIVGSKTILEQRLGGSVETFCYPMGRFNETIRQTVKDAGYTVAVVTNPGKSCPSNDVFAFKRLRISENAGNLFIFWVETSGFYNLIREHRHK